MPKGLPPLVYLLLFSIFLPAHCDLTDGWFGARMMSSFCQASCTQKEEFTCSPFKMIDSLAPHSSSGSSRPALLSPLQGDLVGTGCALPATVAAWRLCMCGVELMRVWVIQLGSRLPSHHACKCLRKAKGSHLDMCPLTQGECSPLLHEIVHVTRAEVLSDSKRPWACGTHTLSGGKCIIPDSLLCTLHPVHTLSRRRSPRKTQHVSQSICCITLGDWKLFIEN